MNTDRFYQTRIERILRHLQGEESGREVSVALGYHPTHFARWMSGQTRIGWTDFHALCSRANVDLPRILRELFTCTGEAGDGARLIRHLMKVNGITETRLAALLDRSAESGAKLAQGDSRVTLLDVMKVADRGVRLLDEFVEALTGEESSARVSAAFDPLAAIFEEWLDTVTAPHSRESLEAQFARRFRLPLGRVRMTVTALLESRVLELQDSTLRRLRSARNVSGSFVLSSAQAKFMTGLALSRFLTADGTPAPSPEKTNVLAHRTLAVSADAARRIQKAFLEFHGRVAEILTKDQGQPKTEFKALLFHFFDLEDTVARARDLEWEPKVVISAEPPPGSGRRPE